VKAVVDTNVIAYYLLGTTQFIEETRAFMAAAKRWQGSVGRPEASINKIYKRPCGRMR
jgi:predicted nucleic acid-binding protein